MSKTWIRQKRPEFVRDVLRDFCKVNVALEEQFRHFDEYGRLVFEELRDLLGHQTNKGLLWRLKDTAHHLFRNSPNTRLVGQFLDWGLGYIFHETIKLKEDCYQQANYGPWFRDMQSQELPREEAIICEELLQVLRQTRQSMEREIARIRFIMFHCKRLFPIYLADFEDNPLLARFLFEHSDLVREVFDGSYDDLVKGIYGDRPERLHVLASQSLRTSGWMEDAARAVSQAVQIAPSDEAVLQEKRIVDNWKRKLKL